MMQEERIKYLFQLHLSKACTPAEREELAALALEEQHVPLVKELISNAWNTTGEEHDLSTEKTNELFTRIIAQKEEAASPESLVVSIKPRIQLWKRIAIAASIIATIGIAAYFIINPERQSKGPAIVGGPTNNADVPAPDKNRAQIKLSDGTIVYLDSAANGQLATQSNVTVTKTEDGKIVYAVIPTKEGSVEYNTLMNPRGSKVQPLTLSDGTKVWLNAESSITYPTAFIGNERKVSITGEAYFEVTRSVIANGVKQSFIVEANGTSTEVLGTHFNVNAYDDEEDIRVTLLEGSVRVISNERSEEKSRNAVVIKPGQQAVVARNEAISLNNSVNLDEVISWKNNKFIFNSASIQAIAKQLEKWYDVDITIQPGFSNHFTGIINRSVNASEVFSMLQRTGTMNVKINGRKIEISK